MNDDFLHRIRKEPRPEFLRSLKERLNRIEGRTPTPAARRRSMRTLFAGILIGASALALASIALKVDFAGVRGMLSRVIPLGDRRGDETARRESENPGDGSNELVPRGRAGQGLRFPWTVDSQPRQAAQAGAARSAKEAAASAGSEVPSGARTTSVASAPASYVVDGSRNVKTPSGVLKILAAPEIEPEIRSFAERIVHNLGPFGALKMPDISVAEDGAALRALCAGGVDGPDIVAVTRRITPTEAAQVTPSSGRSCDRPGPVEIPIGYQAVVILRNKLSGAPNLTSQDLFLALAARVPDPSAGRILVNPYGAWNQIDPALGYEPIQVLGPPLGSGAWRTFVATIMNAGCHKFPALAALENTDARAFEACNTARGGGSYYEEVAYGSRSVSSTSIPSRLAGNPGVIGIVGYMTYEALSRKDPEAQVETMGGVVLVGAIDGILPSRDSLAAGTYPGSRALYMYVSRAHLQLMRDQVEYFVRNFSFPDSMSNDPSLVPLQREVGNAARSQALGKLSSGN